MAKLANYRVLKLDVWGNEEVGFDLNAVYYTNRIYEIDFEDAQQILDQLIAAGELIGYKLDDIKIDGEENRLYIDNAHNGMPLLQLEVVVETSDGSMNGYGVYFDCDYPNFCSNCGEKLSVKDNQYSRLDFNGQNSFSCDCGTKFIRVTENVDLSGKVQKELNHYR